MKRVLVTGADGFIGKNLCVALRRRTDLDLVTIDVGDPQEDLERALDLADVVFHLAGVNRPEKEEDFEVGNVELTEAILSRLRSKGRTPILVLSSSTQAVRDNPYGTSKRKAETAVRDFEKETGAMVYAFRLPGVFGKWCRPNYNSVVATFCHNIARSIPIAVSDPTHEIELVYVGDVVRAFVGLLDGREPERDDGICRAGPTAVASLGSLAEAIGSFKDSRRTLQVPDFSDAFLGKLYATYLSYLPTDAFSYDLEQRSDPRGVLAEFLKSPYFGQLFISRTKPGVTRGNHYHDTKVEKFAVVEGEAVVCFRHILNGEVLEYPVSGREFRVVDIPPGYTHCIKNVGEGEMVVLFWASEIFDPAEPDTYFCEVKGA